MLIITRYILKEHVGPFFLGLATITFAFLLNIVFRELGKFLGKGLSAIVILEFFTLNMAWILALAIPMAVLISTLMAFGRLSADNEIAALKASGVHLYRLMAPVLILAALLAVGMERFNNCVLPDANHHARLLTRDISRKRPTLKLEPNVFFNEIDNYSVLVKDIKKDDLLIGILINDNSDSRYNRTIIAERGRLNFSENPEGLKFILLNGEIHSVEKDRLENYQREMFQRREMWINVSNMVLKRQESEHRGDREKSADMMRRDIENNQTIITDRQDQIRKTVRNHMMTVFPKVVVLDSIDENISAVGYTRGMAQTPRLRIEKINRQIESGNQTIEQTRRSNSQLNVEIEKKYSIPVACIVFILIGAPLGIMARQGGLAIGGGLSLIFFLIYWSFLIGGEQLADRRIIGPVAAMWTPNIVVGIAGFYLVVHSVRESTFIHWDRVVAFFLKPKRRKMI